MRKPATLLCCSVFLLAQAVSAQDSAWQDSVRADLAEREYEITWQERPVPANLDAAWHAPNRAQGFRTYFTPSGIRVVPRTEAVPSWEWGLSWVGYGRGATSWPLPAVTLSPKDNRITYRRGAFEESYENSSRGLKQGFVLPAPAEETTGLVHLDLALSGSLSPIISEDRQSVDFVTPAGVRAVRYSALQVSDARGVAVRAWIEGFSNDGLRGIRLVLDAQEAVYPLAIDALATSPTWTAESDQAEAKFGLSVAGAGDVNGDGYFDLIVGAPYYDNGQTDEGRVFVYHGSAGGLQASPAWTAESDQAGANFGSSVARAGDDNGDGYADVIVGAPAYDNGQTDEGRAFVYHGSAAGLSTGPVWTVESDQAGAALGQAVETAGDVNGDGYADVIVGAFKYSSGETGEGRAFVYCGSAAGLSTSPAWTAEGNQTNARFGGSVGTAGDVNTDGYADVVVGALWYDNGQTDEGRAFVYYGSAAGLSTSAAWAAESDQAGANFGSSVARAGDVNCDGYADVIVGAPGYDNLEPGEGLAFLYQGSAAGLQTSPSWTANGNHLGDASFGASVATAGDFNGGCADVIVGAPGYVNGLGRAYVYHGSAGGLSTSPSWTAGGAQLGESFGVSVATAGDINGDGYADVIVGASSYDNQQLNEGRVLVYLGSATGPSPTAGWTAESNQADARFGVSVATAGDVNGDGYADVIVGASGYDNGQVDEGRAFVYPGSAAGISTSPAWTAESNQAGALFGYSVAAAGDVNGDGYSDIVVGSWAYQNAAGRAFVYHGSSAGLSSSLAWTAESGQAEAQFGLSVATAGDVNGDGYADVIVGAPLYDDAQPNVGRVFVYHGSSGGLSSSSAWTAGGAQANALFGNSVATAGDINGDGNSDVVVGAPLYDDDQLDEGLAVVYHGSSAGLSTNPAWTAEGDGASVHFGVSAATAGDVNGDGYADVIVGAPLYDNPGTDEGRAFLYLGSPAGLTAASVWTPEHVGTHAQFGISVATAGDVNGDGYADVIVGAYEPAFKGRAFTYHGSAAGPSTSPAWTAGSDQSGARFGFSVATAGDVNGDGYADVIVGADGHDNPQADEGRAYVYYGDFGGGLNLRPQQGRTTDAGPIAHLGASDSPHSFLLKLHGLTPFGPGRVKLEWEAKPLGVPFDAVGTTVAGSFADTGPSGVELSGLADNLSEATLYHWRVRLHYDPLTTPLARHSRWLTIPWKGWQESMLRTAAAAGAGRVPDGSTGDPLLLEKASLGQIELTWDASCLAADTDYAIYEGVLGNFTSHDSRFCGTGGATTKTFAPLAGDTYYLVVPLNAFREGSYGTDSSGAERPQAVNACLPQQVAACP